MPGWRNEHLRYRLKGQTKCWFNPDADEMPKVAAREAPKQVGVAPTVERKPVKLQRVGSTPTPDSISSIRSKQTDSDGRPLPFERRWTPVIPGQPDFDNTFETMCGGPCPQLVAQGYATFTDDLGRVRYYRPVYQWRDGKQVRTKRYVN